MNKFNLLLLAAALAPLPVHATLSWNFAIDTTATLNTRNFNGTSTDPSETANQVAVKAYSSTGDVGARDEFQSAYLQSWSGNGLGVKLADDNQDSTSSPWHAFDNDGGTGTAADESPDGDLDAAIFNFGENITLESISIGWAGIGNDAGENATIPDADISILAFDEQAAGSAIPGSIIGKTFSELLTNGWKVIGNYNVDLSQQSNWTGTQAINSGDFSSSYWLVSAYTSTAAGGENIGTLDFGNDFFKIAGLSGKTADSCSGGSCGGSSVPEPTSLFLLTSGLLGWRLNRYNKAQQQTEECMAA